MSESQLPDLVEEWLSQPSSPGRNHNCPRRHVAVQAEIDVREDTVVIGDDVLASNPEKSIVADGAYHLEDMR